MVIATMLILHRDADRSYLVLRYGHNIFMLLKRKAPALTGLLSSPIFCCSPSHEVISVLFRAGTVLIPVILVMVVLLL